MTTKKFRLLVLFVLVVSLSVFAHAKGEGKKEDAGLTPAEILAKYAAETKFADFPTEVVRRAKYLILDNIGCVLGATQTQVGKKYLALGRNMGGGKECTILGSGDKVSWMTAAYINGQLANILDFDDNYDFYYPAHPGIAIVQTALTFGEAVRASGEEMLTAVILGYETSMHVGRAIGPTNWKTSFIYPLPMGTAVVAARLLHLDSKQIADAMRQAGMWTSQPRSLKFDVESNLTVSDTKNEAGSHAFIGILSAYRAQQGFEPREYFLDGDFMKWFMAGGDLEGYDLLTAGPGKTYRILEVSFKPTPSCAFSHPAVTALWEALDHQAVREEEVKEIVFKGVVRLDHPKWEEMLDAQFSMYCILSLTALGVEPGPDWYVTGRFSDPDVRALAKKIKLVNDPDAEKLEIRENKNKCSVKVEFQDGTVKEATIYDVKGSPANPMTDEELQAKFRSNTRALFPESHIKRMIDTILNLERVPHLSALTKLLVSRKLRK